MRNLITYLLIVFTFDVFADGLPQGEHIVVSGTGYIEKYPDFVELQITISKTSETLAEAKRYVDSVTSEVIKAVSNTGVEEKDISASRILAQQDFDWHNGERIYLGQMILRSLTINVRDLDRYSDIVQLVIDSGVTELSGISMKFNDRHKVEREAMEMAVRDASATAREIALGFGRKLGSVYKISEKPVGDHVYFSETVRAMEVGLSSPESGAKLLIRPQRVSQSIYAVFILK